MLRNARRLASVCIEACLQRVVELVYAPVVGLFVYLTKREACNRPADDRLVGLLVEYWCVYV